MKHTYAEQCKRFATSEPRFALNYTKISIQIIQLHNISNS